MGPTTRPGYRRSLISVARAQRMKALRQGFQRANFDYRSSASNPLPFRLSRKRLTACMTIAVDRRLLLKAGTLGVGALAVPGVARHACGARLHPQCRQRRAGAALGDAVDALRAREGDCGRLDWQVSPTADFARIVSSGKAAHRRSHDHCVKPVAAGSGRAAGIITASATAAASHRSGRTRTLPEGRSRASAPRSFPARTCPSAISTPMPMPRRATTST